MSDDAAAHLAATTGSPVAPIALLAPQSALAFVGLVAVLKSGRPLVVLDPLTPHERVTQILERSGSQLLVLGRHGETDLEGRSFGVPTVDLQAVATEPSTQSVVASPGLDDVACIIYTSGSTGEPKGVAFTHAALLNEAAGGRELLGINPADRCAMVMPLAFMAGFTVALFASMNGASLYSFDPRVHGGRDLPHWLDSNELTTLHLTPSLLRSLLGVLDYDQVLSSVRLVTTCGEPVHGTDVTELRRHLTDAASFVNWSGASEVGQLSFHEIGPNDPVPVGVVPVGRLASHKHVDILSSDGSLLGPGEIGEIVVRSRYLAAGYWRDPVSTSERFTRLENGDSSYRMGDLGRLDADGTLHLLGRIGTATKIRGYLVDPSEVEAALTAAPGVAEAVAVVADSETGNAVLNAYVVPQPHERMPSPSELRRLVAEKLPSWMVPSNVVALNEMPRNERGKIERDELPPPQPRGEVRIPDTQWEVAVAELWREILNIDEIGVDDDFLQLGGDSLGVVEMLAAVDDRFGVSVTTTEFARMSTLADFAAHVGAPKRGGTSNASVAALRAEGEMAPLFCVAGAGDLAVGFMPLTLRLDHSIPVYGIQQVGLEEPHRPAWSIESAARNVCEAIREARPSGPYHLLGHSMGGLVALEAAHMLRNEGHAVLSLIILDSYLRGKTRVTHRQTSSWRDKVVNALPNQLREVMPTILNRRTIFPLVVRLPVVGFVRFQNSIQWDLFALQGWLITQMYRPRPWDGPALFVSARDNRHREKWKRVLVGPHKFCDMDLEHSSMILEPGVSLFAAEINQWVASGPGR